MKQAEVIPQSGSDIAFENIARALLYIRHRWFRLAAVPIAAGVGGYLISFLIAPTFTSRTSFLPPQQQQTAAASAIASLGALSGLAGAAANVKTPGDQYVSLLQSDTVADRLIDQFKLMELYDVRLRIQARKELAKNVRILLGKKDGIIVVEADANSPKLAADLANQHVKELKRLSGDLALTEAQQRRAFFESQMKGAREKLTTAQQQLQQSGFSAGALNAEPKAAAESYAKLKAQVVAAELQLRTIRQSLTDSSTEVRQRAVVVDALNQQLREAESTGQPRQSSEYLNKYRDFKYQEALFEIFSKQYEIARTDESKEGALIQVIDPAQPPELKSRPRRGLIAAGASACALILTLLWTLLAPGIGKALKRRAE